jgi:hypothetical protein
LQQLTTGKRADEIVRENPVDEIHARRRTMPFGNGGAGGSGRGAAWVGVVHARTDLQQIAPDQADGQGHGGQHFEIDQRPQAELADALDVAGRRDAVDHGEEHQRRDGGLDQFEENVAEDLENWPPFRAPESRTRFPGPWPRSPETSGRGKTVFYR